MMPKRFVLSFPSIYSDICKIEMMDLDGIPLFHYALKNLQLAHPDATIVVEAKSMQVVDYCRSIKVATIDSLDIMDADEKVSAYQPFLFSQSEYNLPHIYKNLKVEGLANYMMANYIIERIHTYDECKCIKQKKAKAILEKSVNSEKICLLGDSLIEYWNVKELKGLGVFNAGIGDLTARECDEWLVGKMKLASFQYLFLIIGTNDLKYKHPIPGIVDNVKSIVFKIKALNPELKIIYLLVPNVHCRWDRRNDDIEVLNSMLAKELAETVSIISPQFLNNSYGELDKCNTLDGLHFSPAAYSKLKEQIENIII